jgi:hypothetical protein
MATTANIKRAEAIKMKIINVFMAGCYNDRRDIIVQVRGLWFYCLLSTCVLELIPESKTVRNLGAFPYALDSGELGRSDKAECE